MRVYIGFDSAEERAYRVTVGSLKNVSPVPFEPLDAEVLQAAGLYWRTVDKRWPMYDLPSNAPCSTEFASTRFLVPLLCQTGWALFVDCDMLFFADPRELMALADPDKAVMVVKHNHHGEGMKMNGLVQTAYSRKNWSSVMLFNCDHPANRRLSVRDVNERPGRDLHRFYWLHDSEIGELPAEWNWLVNIQPQPDNVKIAHYTSGGPWIPDWKPADHDDLWLATERELDK